jgi:hypothetical protein
MPKPINPEKKLEWEEKIRQQRESGLSMDRWCRENQIPAHTFHYWRDRLFPKPPLTRACFKELPTKQENGIVLEYRGVCIHIEKSFDIATLKACLSALKGM